MNKTIHKLMAFVLSLLVLVCFSVSSFCAQAKFSLEDTQTKENRIFDVALTAKDCEDISAFVCELTFDQSAIEYRGYSLNVKDALFQVNSQQKGCIKAVFLCEEGVRCNTETPLVTLSFKAIKAGDYNIYLNVSQLINSASENIEADYEVCSVSVAKKPVTNSKDKADKTKIDGYEVITEDSFLESTSIDEEKNNRTQVKTEGGNEVLVLLSFVVLFLLIMVVILYKPISKILTDNKEKRKK